MVDLGIQDWELGSPIVNLEINNPQLKISNWSFDHQLLISTFSSLISFVIDKHMDQFRMGRKRHNKDFPIKFHQSWQTVSQSHDLYPQGGKYYLQLFLWESAILKKEHKKLYITTPRSFPKYLCGTFWLQGSAAARNLVCTWADLSNVQGDAGPPLQTETIWAGKVKYLCISASPVYYRNVPIIWMN